MKAYNFNVRALHAICFVLALVLLVAGLQAFFVANAATLAGSASVYPGHAIAKMACGLFLGACAWFDALEKQHPYAYCSDSVTYSYSDTKAVAQHMTDQAVKFLKMELDKSVTGNPTPLTGSGTSSAGGTQHGQAERHRARLEELAMHCLATAALPHEERFTPKEAGARLREAMDALIGCNCGPNEACANCPSHTEATATAGKHKRLWPLEPHQLRVLEEHEELDERLRKLMNFMGNPQFNDLPDAEKDLLRQQSEHMQAYASVLHKRINAFYKLSTL
ncbi:hypothetical protein KXJ72_11280 [Comamonas aquatica]|nr:hypothetical protein KXJ72_11280 [Comamonas aquatica]